jgi:hypothetical protein
MINEIVTDLKKLIILSGQLSEIHIKNIKMFPFIFFDGVQSAEVTFDLDIAKERDGAMSVCYRLKFKKGFSKIDNLQQRCQALENAVKNLLWKEVDVAIYKNKSKKRLNSNG